MFVHISCCSSWWEPLHTQTYVELFIVNFFCAQHHNPHFSLSYCILTDANMTGVLSRLGIRIWICFALTVFPLMFLQKGGIKLMLHNFPAAVFFFCCKFLDLFVLLLFMLSTWSKHFFPDSPMNKKMVCLDCKTFNLNFSFHCNVLA